MQKLPEFEVPPVVETVLSTQFEAIADMRTVHFGLFWERVRQRFPKTEEKPALDAVIERFDEKPKRAPRLRFEAREDAKPERMWFLNAGGTEMIQLQTDRFIKNWRKVGDEDAYPRYEKTILPGFHRDWEVFQEFLEVEKLGGAAVNQCEVSYVNHIAAGQGWQSWREAGKVFSFLGGLPTALEDGAFVLRFPVIHQDKQVGRLTVEIHPAIRESDERAMYAMKLTARGMTEKGIDFFDIGRAAVVSAFAELTTPAMHEIWGRKA